MRLITDLAELERGRPTVLTMGSFDGVHRGHQFLIRQVVDRARRLDYDSVVLTFDPRPEVVLREGSLQITDGETKARIIAALGPDIVGILPFNREVSQIPAGQFLISILDHINLAEFWVGADFGFGHKRQGDVHFLIRSAQQNGFSVHVIPRRPLLDVPISSSLVRSLVSEGQVAEAARYLGHYVVFGGEVVTGAGRGAKMGFPTANLQTAPSQLVPATGIYAAFARLDGERLPAAVSIGYNVQFGGQELKVEAFILDFAADLVGRQIGLEMVERVREERKFESVDALIAQMEVDVEEIRGILARADEPGELILNV